MSIDIMLSDDIIRLIEEGINDQRALLEGLKLLGHEITQSSISRKLKQLGVTKLNGKYQLILSNIHFESHISFVPPNMIVVRTVPGHANVIAASIDEYLIKNNKHPEFIGTIAGDDTIFIAINLDGQDVNNVIKKLKEII